ncbi:nucleolus and neural progenitor protein isoform X1 [Pantherophis guttatus]|uniref:Nucleolus and neural progenitor protein isoform X1 n=1 Tax=Pantherophis guttatus TaxID=94885 RepID=A0A6P9B901_PANGU|nr:nucleolus and neural progenitor protein isoform X1 [Pantherophis guttatus]
MAAPGGGEMVWNRWDVPWPACNSAEVVPAEHASVRCLSAVLKRCWTVDSMLNSKMLVAEQSLLHSIIYNYHYQMIHQKAYGSLKQVEQCLKRLNLMNLEKSIQKIAQMDPIKQKSENSEQSLVPSQPVIEVVLVKILGSCKLILRLLECCCTAFSLIVKHLCLEEYVLFNTLILGLLSRLWILYEAVLKKLSTLYKDLFELLQEVAKIHQRPYIKGFVFPSEINYFLETSYLDIKKKMPKAFIERKTGTGWINTLFSVQKTISHPLNLSVAVPPAVRKKKKKKRKGTQNTSDIGKPVLINRTNQGFAEKLEFDLKTLCKYPNPVSQKNSKFSNILPESKKITSISSKALRSRHLHFFVSKFKEVQSFEELSQTLKTTVIWCKNNKFRSGAFFLGMKLLKSKRLQHVEAQGCRLQRKLRCVKATICKFLTLQSCRERPVQLLRGNPQRSSRLSRKQSCLSQTTSVHRGSPLFKGTQSPFLNQCFLFQTLGSSGTKIFEESIHISAPAVLESHPTHIQKEATEQKDDIDDIFKIIGL